MRIFKYFYANRCAQFIWMKGVRGWCVKTYYWQQKTNKYSWKDFGLTIKYTTTFIKRTVWDVQQNKKNWQYLIDTKIYTYWTHHIYFLFLVWIVWNNVWNTCPIIIHFHFIPEWVKITNEVYLYANKNNTSIIFENFFFYFPNLNWK